MQLSKAVDPSPPREIRRPEGQHDWKSSRDIVDTSLFTHISNVTESTLSGTYLLLKGYGDNASSGGYPLLITTLKRNKPDRLIDTHIRRSSPQQCDDTPSQLITAMHFTLVEGGAVALNEVKIPSRPLDLLQRQFYSSGIHNDRSNTKSGSQDARCPAE